MLKADSLSANAKVVQRQYRPLTLRYATIANIIAYLPFLLLKGSTGDFLYNLPIMTTASLVSSRLASMTFIPLLV